jgi:3-hydroxy-9,10-secoandrosta-1,3,5(10)-triene-9,17-dione monooxygenase
MAHDSGAPSTMTREQLLERAASLIPTLRERAVSCEAARSCPAETVEDFRRNGLLRICQPARYGGFELGWDVLAEVVQTLARGCASQAWIAMVLNDHCQLLGTFPLEAQDEVWGQKADTFLSASLDPIGKASRISGGVLYSGRHGFSSGIDHVRWVICGGHIEGDDSASYFVLPKRDVTIIDDWQVMGLAGTGSKSFVVENVFVPEQRILDVRAAAEEGNGPGTLINRTPVYRVPRSAIAPLPFAGIAIGIAEGFIEEYLRYTRPRKSRGVPMAELMGTQIAAGRAASEVEAAARLNLATARDAMAVLARGELLPQRQRFQTRCNAAIAAQLALGAVQQLFNMAGGRTLYQSNVLQRLMRDMLAAASHHALDWNAATANYGRELLEMAG